MFCNKCGKELVEGAAFCSFCGAQVAAPVQPEVPAYEAPVAEAPAAETPAYETPAYAAPAQQYAAPQQYTSPQQFETPQYTAPVEGNPEAGGALAMGIVSTCLCYWPFVSIVSIILGAVGVKKSNRALWYANHGGGKKALAIIGKVFSLTGLVIGAIMTFCWFMMFILGLLNG